MAITFDEALSLRKSVEDEYRSRHDDLRRLRRCWHGDYWKDFDRGNADGLLSLFKDLGRKRSDVGPDIRIVHNVLQEICVKYMTYLSGLPQILMYIDPPLSDRSRAQATLKERALYGLWSEPDRTGRSMPHIVNDAGWYLPLQGDCYLGIWPDFERNIPRPVLRSAEYAYPIPDFQGTGTDCLIFSWQVPESRLKRAFPDYVPRSERNRGKFRRFPGKPGGSDPVVELIEFSDTVEWHRWADGQELNGVVHNHGFNLWENLFFIHVPDEPFNHGAVEQIVGLVEAGNALHSMLVQEVFETVFSPIVLEDPMKFGETIDTGPGAVLAVNAGGRAYRLDPASGALGAHVGFLNVNDQMAKQGGAMPDVNFGVSPASSIVTGKAVNELQGASTGSTVEMVQAVGIGQGLVNWNAKALHMLATMFRDEQIYLHGTYPRSIADLRPTAFGLKFKGSQIVGSQRNEVVFSPHLNMHEKIVMGLQLAGAGLVSKRWQRDQVGIPDSEAMDEEIASERIEDAVVGALEQELLAEPTPQHAVQAENEAVSFLSGATSARPAAQQASAALPPGPPPAAGPAGGPDVMGGKQFGSAGGTGQVVSPALPLPPGAPTPAEPPGGPGGPTAGPAPQPSGTVKLAQVEADFNNVEGLQGRVFLVGEIVQRGESNGDIEVAVTSDQDRDTLTQALPQYHLVFHHVTSEPTEPHVEVGANVAAAVPA